MADLTSDLSQGVADLISDLSEAVVDPTSDLPQGVADLTSDLPQGVVDLTSEVTQLRYALSRLQLPCDSESESESSESAVRVSSRLEAQSLLLELLNGEQLEAAVRLYRRHRSAGGRGQDAGKRWGEDIRSADGSGQWLVTSDESVCRRDAIVASLGRIPGRVSSGRL